MWLSQEWTMCCSASHSGPVPCHGLCLLVKLEYITAMCWEHVNQKVIFLCYSAPRRIKKHFKISFPTPYLVEISFCHDPDFSCSVISHFISKLCRHVLLFSSSVCVISLPPVFFSVPFPHLSFARLPPPAPHRLISVCECECVVFVCPLCISPASSSIILAFLLLTSRYVLVLCSLCFYWFVRLHFVSALLSLLCVFVILHHFWFSWILIVFFCCCFFFFFFILSVSRVFLHFGSTLLS